jgi:YHS domain-containing protein
MKKIIGLNLCMMLFVLSQAQQSEIFANKGTAVNGYDVVAYFTESKPVKGSEAFFVNWKNVKWLFASTENAALFQANPEKYAPQYGGYCAYGCSRGYKAKTSSNAWTIVNGKLYLNYDTGVRNIWDKDRQNFINKADSNWHVIKDSRYP